jgi:hypothetical protein
MSSSDPTGGTGEWSGEWTWTHTDHFAQDCRDLDDDPGEVDYLTWLIAESVLSNPIEGSLPYFDEDGPLHDPAIRYFRTFESRHSELPPRVVVFRVEPPPDGDEPREVTGLCLEADPEGSSFSTPPSAAA